MFTTRSPMQKARKKSILLVHEDKNKHLFFSLRLAGFAIAAWVLLHNSPNIPKSASFKMSKAERLQKIFCCFYQDFVEDFLFKEIPDVIIRKYFCLLCSWL